MVTMVIFISTFFFLIFLRSSVALLLGSICGHYNKELYIIRSILTLWQLDVCSLHPSTHRNLDQLKKEENVKLV